jgi:DNA topoisomerase-1
MLRTFWDEFSHAVDQTKDLKISDVIAALDEDLGPHFFPPREDGSDPRACQACGTGRLGLKLGRYGSFIGCSNYPNCQYTRRLAIENGEDQGETLKEGMRVLGHHPDTGEDITVRRGPYGLYVQQGENGEDKKVKPRRTSLPRGMDGEQITLEQALGLLSLPRAIGTHPETRETIEAGIGRFGPYVRMGAVFGSLDRDDDVLAIGINRAVDLIARKMASVRTLGAHPADKELVAVRKGRFGPYVQHGKTVANLPRGVMMEEITLDDAVTLLAEKGKQLRPRGAAGRRGRGAAVAKKAAAGAVQAVEETRAAPAKRKVKPAKRRAAKAKRVAPKPVAKRVAAAKAPAKKKTAARGKKAAAGAATRQRAAR